MKVSYCCSTERCRTPYTQKGASMNQNSEMRNNQQNTAASRFCSKCGGQLSAQAVFCPKCGKPVKAAAQQSMPMPNQPNVQQSPYQQAQTNSVRQTTDKKAKTYITLGVICFIALAVIAAAVFYFLGLSYIAIAAVALLLAVLLVVQITAAKRSGAATALLVVAGVIFSAVLLVAFLPSDINANTTASLSSGQDKDDDVIEGDDEVVIEPSDEDTVIDYGDFTIMIPGGTVSQDETLTVTESVDVPEAFEDFDPLCDPMDVDLGELKQFDTPIEIEFEYDISKVKDFELDAGDAFIAVYYNEETGYWDEVPYEVDEDTGVVRLIMDHLTTIQCYYSMWESSMVYDNESVKVIFDTTDKLISYYEIYEQKIGRTTTIDNVPQFVVDVADYAVKILDAYESQGLPVVSYPKIYITANDNYYATLSGNVFLAAVVCQLDNPDINMACNLGHELTHATQYELLGISDYIATSKSDRFFWMEASAEYMGITEFWEFTDETPFIKYDQYQLAFFKTSLIAADQTHAYEAGNFLYYVQQLNWETPLDILSLPKADSSFEELFNNIYSNETYPDLLAYYRQFLKASFDSIGSSDNQMNFNYGRNNVLNADTCLNNYNALDFDLDENANPLDNQSTEGSAILTFESAYTADFYEFMTNCDTTLTITPDSDVLVYRFDYYGQGYDLFKTAEAGQPTEIEFGVDDFIVITQVSDAAGTLSFSYEAVPTLSGITGKWELTALQFVDIEGSDDFVNDWLEYSGYDTEESYLADFNAQFQAMMEEMVFDFIVSKDPNNQDYSIELNDGGIFHFIDGVNYNEGILTFSTEPDSDGLGMTLTLKVDGNTMTGTMHSDGYVELNGSYNTGILVNNVTFQHTSDDTN